MNASKILVIDEARFMRQMLAAIISPMGQEVIEASNQAEASQLFTAHRPFLVFVDVCAPFLDYQATIRELIQIEPKVAVVACAMPGQQEAIVDAIRAGACDFVTKPFSQEKVRELARKFTADEPKA